MRCEKCGNEIAEGNRTCEYCGAPVRMRNSGRKKRRNLTLVAAAATLIMLGVLSLMCAGISIKAELMGTSVRLSLPVISASSVVGLVVQGGFVKLLPGLYIALCAAAVIAAFISVFMIITRRRSGVTIGLIAALVSAVMGIAMIIAVFVINGKYGGEALSLAPSLWMWVSVPVNILSALFLFIENDDIV